MERRWIKRRRNVMMVHSVRTVPRVLFGLPLIVQGLATAFAVREGTMDAARVAESKNAGTKLSRRVSQKHATTESCGRGTKHVITARVRMVSDSGLHALSIARFHFLRILKIAMTIFVEMVARASRKNAMMAMLFPATDAAMFAQWSIAGMAVPIRMDPITLWEPQMMKHATMAAHALPAHPILRSRVKQAMCEIWPAQKSHLCVRMAVERVFRMRIAPVVLVRRNLLRAFPRIAAMDAIIVVASRDLLVVEMAYGSVKKNAMTAIRQMATDAMPHV